MLSRPILFSDLGEVWLAFHELHRARPVNGFEPSPIPTMDVMAWFAIYGVHDFDERAEMFRLISVLDQTWIEWARSKMPKKKKHGNSEPSN